MYPRLLLRNINFIFILLSAAVAEKVCAQPIDMPSSNSVPCGTLEKFGGAVQVLNPSRARALDLENKMILSCGSWVSVAKGWAVVRSIEGQKAQLGPGTFLQILHPRMGGLSENAEKGDTFTLLKGKIFVRAPTGTSELRIATANARARVERGNALVMYSDTHEESQVVSMGVKVSLENRFENQKVIALKPGEMSTLNFKVLRVVPSTARAIMINQLKAQLNEVHLEDREITRSIQIAQARNERKFAAQLIDDFDPADEVFYHSREKKSQRAPAQVKINPEDYARYIAQEGDEELNAHLKKKITAGDPDGEKLLESVGSADSKAVANKKSSGRKPASADPDAEDKKKEKLKQKHKKELLNEISKLKPDSDS